ncbi:MAG: hypothetical protein GEU75_11470 [Dehalococcoidia bacterium]|nr:hypothetical protein [Dehalococcoidia bacterium]
MTESFHLAGAVVEQLKGTPVPDGLRDSRVEREYQLWIGGVIGEQVARLGNGLVVRLEAERGGVRPVKLLGTSFWPDIAVYDQNEEPLLAIEVKCLTRRNLPSHVSQPIGQAFLYREMYHESIVALVLVEPLEPLEFTEQLLERLSTDHIELVAIEAFTAATREHLDV